MTQTTAPIVTRTSNANGTAADGAHQRPDHALTGALCGCALCVAFLARYRARHQAAPAWVRRMRLHGLPPYVSRGGDGTPL